MGNDGGQGAAPAENVSPTPAPKWAGVLNLIATVHSWRGHVVDMVGGAGFKLSGSATVEASGDARLPKIVVSAKDCAPLDSVVADIFFRRRDDSSGQKAESAEPAHDPASPWPSTPIGRVSGWDEIKEGWFRSTPTTLVVEVALAADHFDELRSRYISRLSMPAAVHFTIPNAKLGVVQAGDDGTELRLVIADTPQEITQATWTYGHAREKSWLDSPLTGPGRAVLGDIDWTHDGWKATHDQFRTIAGELVASAITEVRHGRSHYDDPRIAGHAAWHLATELYQALADAEYATRAARGRRKSKIKDKEAVQSFPWHKRAPSADFNQGLDSRSWSSISAADLAELAQRYIAHGWHSPTFEWVMVDAMVYSEVREFGEHVKMTNPLINPWFSGRYEENAGNLHRILRSKIPGQLVSAFVKMALWIGIPGYYAYQYWQTGDQEAAILIGAAWLAVTLIWPRIRRSLRAGQASQQDDLRRQTELLGAMSAAYTDISLDRPASVAKRSLEVAADKGASWPGDVWSMLVLADRRDPVSWRHSIRDREVLHLALKFRFALDEEVKRRQKAGERIPQPRFDGRCFTVEGAEAEGND